MKIRLAQESFSGYTGHLGDIYFEDGVSVDHVAPASAHRLAVIMAIETVNGEDPSSLSMMHDLHYASNENVGEVLRGKYQTFEESAEPEATVETQQVVSSPKVKTPVYSKDVLESIADKEGISGLREIADKHDIKGRSIAELIEELSEIRA